MYKTALILRTLLFAIVFSAVAHAADHIWVLQHGTLTYHVSHPLHQTDGVSHEVHEKVCVARGSAIS